MKVILVNPSSDTFRMPEENLGLAYLKSHLVSNGFETEIIDAYLENFSVAEVVRQVTSSKECFFVGLSPYIDSLLYSKEITNEVKKRRADIKVCWGGHLASFSAQELLSCNENIDFIVRGEGERTLQEILEVCSYQDEQQYDKVRGLVYKDESGRIILNPKRDLLENLDELPFPDRSKTLISAKGNALVQISGSRGCYGNCSFCSINSLYKLSNGKSWRGRSAKNIVDELETLYSQGYSMFKFVDDSFFGPGKDWRHRAFSIANEIMARGLRIRFRISTRANNVEREVFSHLKDAGLYSVSIGIESGVQRALDTFRKGITVEQNEIALEVLKDLGIITLMGFIGFDPYITLEELECNLDFLKKHSFCLTDLVSKPLYVHADDEITRTLIKEGKVIERKFPNFIYEIDDVRAKKVLRSLEYWNAFNKHLFYRISDPITAPRITTEYEEVVIGRLHQEMRFIDLGVFEGVVKMVKLGYSQESIFSALEDHRRQVVPKWQKIEQEFNQLSN